MVRVSNVEYWEYNGGVSGKTEQTLTIRDQNHEQVQGPEIPGLVVLYSEVPVVGEGVYPGRSEMTVGRNPDQFVFLDDKGLSRCHVVIRYDPAGITVEDQKSHNGTFLNGRRLEAPTSAAPKDLLRCGRNLLMFSSDIRVFEGWRIWGQEPPLVGGPAIRSLRREIAAFAGGDLEVLLLGESGTGKELAAQELHNQSGRSGSMVPVNCAAFPETLFESELFGVARGAFTGAVDSRPGLFQRADGGTLFLDEVAELCLGLQAKLLRVVEQKEVRPVGGNKSIHIDVRLVAATNRDLMGEVRRGNFREDLYHRLHGAEIRMPPLRDRREDIPLLVEHMIQQQAGSSPPPPSAAFMEKLISYRWPGNVRELDRVLREALSRAAAMGARQLFPAHLRQDICDFTPPEEDPLQQIREALIREKGNVSKAAAALGTSRARIYSLLNERGLKPDEFR